MIDTLVAAVSGLKATIDLTKSALDTVGSAKHAELKLALTERMLEVQQASMGIQQVNAALLQEKHALAHEKRELENQLAQLKRQSDKMANYEPFRTPVGAIVYLDKTSVESTQGPIYACPSCMDSGKAAILQPIHGGSELLCLEHGSFGMTIEPMRGPVGAAPARRR